MKLKRMKQHLRGAFTVAAPQKRLRMWTGLPIFLGAGASHWMVKTKVKELVMLDRPYAGALLHSAVPLAVGAVLTAIPYTRRAGMLALGLSALSTAATAYTYGTEAGRKMVALYGSSPVRILRG